jgi:hypothetical protein
MVRPSVMFPAAAALSLLTPAAAAHAMQLPYTLPVPLWLYAYGATGALLASFVMVGYFVKATPVGSHARFVDLSRTSLVRTLASPVVIAASRSLSVVLLTIVIVTGLFGTRYPAANFNVTFFWIIFALGFTYAIAIVGDVYRIVNPWLAICDWCEGAWPSLFRGRISYPASLGYCPALVLYMGWIWLELFGLAVPRTLSLVLIAYSVLNVAAAWLFGKDVWFRHGELFSVFFRLFGMQAPIEYRCGAAGDAFRVRLRAPFVGLGNERADHWTLLLFVLFMLSSTAFDGIHDTVPWVDIFWTHLYPLLATIIAFGDPRQYLVLIHYFYYWQWVMLVLSPFIYLVIYLAFIALAKLITRTSLPVRTLALQFTLSLVPIAFVYNVTHYFTLLISQGPAVVSLASDPFGFGWNLFGTKGWYAQPYMFQAETVWHLQVGFILLGHIVSVYLAHVEALKVFKSSREAALSQIPLLLLMVMLTTIGLWILSLPIAAGQVLLPQAING